HKTDVASPLSGFVHTIQCERVGSACVVLGGGRERKEDSVDPAVGIIVHKKVRDAVTAGEPLCTILYNSEDRARQAQTMLEQSYQITSAPPTRARPLIHRIITGSSMRTN
ncbi:MAG: pyrimidine-nucleoside phosphorylase, partial [Acidobacteria bacterium]